MRLTPLQLSFCFSIFFHTIGIGVFVVLVSMRHESATLPPQENLVILTLVAAPDESAEQAETPKAEPKPLSIESLPTTITRTDTKPSEISITGDSIRPAVAQSKPLSYASPATVRGDSSSPAPGLDATTQQAQAGAKAEPNYLKNPKPPYPLAARRRREQGLVLLAVTVTTQGSAASVVLKQSSGFPLLDDAALNAVREWEFQPARIDSIAVESKIEVPVRFKLTD